MPPIDTYSGTIVGYSTVMWDLCFLFYPLTVVHSIPTQLKMTVIGVLSNHVTTPVFWLTARRNAKVQFAMTFLFHLRLVHQLA